MATIDKITFADGEVWHVGDWKEATPQEPEESTMTEQNKYRMGALAFIAKNKGLEPVLIQSLPNPSGLRVIKVQRPNADCTFTVPLERLTMVPECWAVGSNVLFMYANEQLRGTVRDYGSSGDPDAALRLIIQVPERPEREEYYVHCTPHLSKWSLVAHSMRDASSHIQHPDKPALEEEALVEEAPTYTAPELKEGDKVTWVGSEDTLITEEVTCVRDGKVYVKNRRSPFYPDEFEQDQVRKVERSDGSKFTKSNWGDYDEEKVPKAEEEASEGFGVSILDARRAVDRMVPVDVELRPYAKDKGLVPVLFIPTVTAVFEFEDGEWYEIPRPDPRYWTTVKPSEPYPKWPGLYADFFNKDHETVRISCHGPTGSHKAFVVRHKEGAMGLHDMAPILKGRHARLVSSTIHKVRRLLQEPPPERYGE